jgi:hypothetical protein
VALLVAETAHGGLFGDRALTPAYDSLVPQAVKEWLQSRAQFRSLG